MKHHSPDFTQLSPGHRTCSFISYLNSPGSIQSGCHFWCTKVFKHTSVHCPTRFPLTPGLRECTCEQSTLPRRTMPEHIQRSRGSNPRSLACMYHMLPLSHDAPQYRIVQSETRVSDVRLLPWLLSQWLCHAHQSLGSNKLPQQLFLNTLYLTTVFCFWICLH